MNAVLLLLGLVAPADFPGWFRAAAEGRLVLPAEVVRDARGHRYVFVSGFRNERMPGEFAQNAKELRAWGVPRRAIHVISPSSDRTIEENAEEVRARFREIADEGPEDLVVIAHSRGACDALAFALENPGFVRDRVRALFLVQGPFGGTGVADYLIGDGPSMDRLMPPVHRLLAHLLGRFEARLLNRGRHGGLPGMARDPSRAFWSRMLATHVGSVPIVGPKTFYITAATRPSRLRLFQRATCWYLGTYFGPNDGLVALRDQSLPGLGTVLAVLDSGHTDLTGRFPSTRAPRRLRRALIRAILLTVAHPRDAVARP